MVQDRDSYNGRLMEIMYALSNGMISNDLEWGWRSLLLF